MRKTMGPWDGEAQGDWHCWRLEMFAGIGHTVVDGAKFSGENVKEFFTGKK
jgi:hypothetical protein